MPIYFKIFVALIAAWLIFVLVNRIWNHFFPKPIPPDSAFPDSKFVQIEQFNIRYVQRGNKNNPNLVLIHGLCASIYSWRLIIDKLAKDYFVTAFDLPGFGFSDKHPHANYGLDAQTTRVFAMLDHLQITHFYLVGHSMGGGLSAWMAKIRPDRVVKLGLIAPAIHHKFINFKPDSWLWGIHLVKNIAVTPTMVKRIYKHVCYRHSPKDLSEIVFNYYRPYNRNPNAVVTFFKSIDLLRDPRLFDKVSALKCPTVLLYADHDPVIKKKNIEKYLKTNSKASGQLISDCGHMLAEEKPDAIHSYLHSFFVESGLV